MTYRDLPLRDRRRRRRRHARPTGRPERVLRPDGDVARRRVPRVRRARRRARRRADRRRKRASASAPTCRSASDDVREARRGRLQRRSGRVSRRGTCGSPSSPRSTATRSASGSRSPCSATSGSSRREAKLAFAHVRRGVAAGRALALDGAAGDRLRAHRRALPDRAARSRATRRRRSGSRAVRCPAARGAARRARDGARTSRRTRAPLSVALSKRLLWESRSLDPRRGRRVARPRTTTRHGSAGRARRRDGVPRAARPRWSLAVPRDWPADAMRRRSPGGGRRR